MMLMVWSLTVFLTTTVQCLPLSSSSSSSSSEGPSLVFTAGSPGYGQLEEVPVDGSLSLSFSFKTGASDAQLLYMREVSTGDHISISLSDGALNLKVDPDTIITSVNEERFNDNQWHNVVLNIIGGHVNIIIMIIDDTPLPTSIPQSLPLLDNTKYETFIGGLSPSLSVESEAPYVGCIRDIQVLQTQRTLEDIQVTGAAVEECGLTSQDYIPIFEGKLLGVITETHEVGSVIMTIQAVTGDRNSQMIYELLDNPQDYFTLDQTTGNLTIAKELDRVALAPPNNVLTLTVTAKAGSGPGSSSTAEVTIILKQADTTTTTSRSTEVIINVHHFHLVTP